MMNIFEKLKEALEQTAFGRQLAAGIKHPSTHDMYLEEYTVREVEKIIDGVEKEYGNGWIACADKMPKKMVSVLIFTHKETEPVIAWHKNGIWRNSSTDLPISAEVIAWQPLPGDYVPKTVDLKPLIKDVAQFEQLEKAESVLNGKQSNETKMSEEELLVAKVFLDDLERRNGSCNEIETLRNVLTSYEKTVRLLQTHDDFSKETPQVNYEMILAVRKYLNI